MGDEIIGFQTIFRDDSNSTLAASSFYLQYSLSFLERRAKKELFYFLRGVLISRVRPPS